MGVGAPDGGGMVDGVGGDGENGLRRDILGGVGVGGGGMLGGDGKGDAGTGGDEAGETEGGGGVDAEGFVSVRGAVSRGILYFWKGGGVGIHT